MTFEGEYKQIEMRGIERMAADGVAQDGGMNEVINLVPRNGSYVPYSATDVEKWYNSYTANAKFVRIHHTSTGDNIVIVEDNTLKILRWNDSAEQADELVTKTMQVNDVVFIGNRMDLDTTDGIEHWLWKNGEYTNLNDLNVYGGLRSLPGVSFCVNRGLFDGTENVGTGQYVRVYSGIGIEDADLANFVTGTTNVAGDMLATLDSVRHMGGITGYVLVAAAYRLKGSPATNPKYIMASPILLMGAPEIYIRDGKVESQPSGERITRPTDIVIDGYNFAANRYGDNFDHDTYYRIWNMLETDSRSPSDMIEGEHFTIRTSTSYTICTIYKKNTQSKINAVVPALFTSKYAAKYRDSSGANSRGVRSTFCLGNMLSFFVDGAILEEYKDELDGLCIFMSPVISPYKTIGTTGMEITSTTTSGEATGYDSWDGGSNEVWVRAQSFLPQLKSIEKIEQEIQNIAGLYKVREYPIDSLENREWVRVDLSGGILSTDRMVQQSDTMLKISDMMPVGFTKGHLFGYNERLHVYNFQKNEVYRLPYQSSLIYAGGYGQYPASYRGGVYPYQYAMEVTDSKGSVIVYKFSSLYKTFNPMICLADIDSKQVVLHIKYSENGAYYYGSLLISELMHFGGISCCNKGLNNAEPIEIPVTEVTEETYDNAFDDIVDTIVPDSNAYGKNEIRVSETATTIFEADKSYQIGKGEILALARLTIGLSQDNYGKQPLVVFCTDGVYTLGVDSTGKYAYSGQTPLSRVVCTNVNGICELDGAVLFPSAYGMYMVTVEGVKAIPLQASGKHMNLPLAENGLKAYQGAINHEQLVKLSHSISDDDFLDYIQDEKTYIRYLHAMNVALVYNKTYAYSYVIDLTTWNVTKLDTKVLYDDGDYPEQCFRVVTKSGSTDVTHTVQFDYYSGKDNEQTLLVTRPILLDSYQLKSAYRFVLRGMFEHVKASVSEADRYAGMYVYGSLDGEHWDYLNGMEKKLSGNRFHDIGVETHRVSYKYMMVIFAGMLSKDSHIDRMEMTGRIKYNNKLK